MDFEENYQQCLDKLLWVNEQLEVKIPQAQLYKIAKLIVQTMTGPWRYFHSTEHIFEVGGYRDAIEVLAALFHDIVYVQVDGSVNFNLTYYLTPFIREEEGKMFIQEKSEYNRDSDFEMVAAIFGYVPGQPLSPFSGQNEFLSAVVTAKVLSAFLSPSLIVQIVACIEATIPFRSKSESGLSPCEVLYERLKLTNEQFNLQLTEEEIIQTLKRSVRVANRDVYSFANQSSAIFLSSTWSLLPETNHNLQKSGSYTVRDYRIAMQKMANFMNFLNPDLIFRQFQGEPDDQTYQSLVEQARTNLQAGRLYLESKLVTIAILEALSLRIGSDVSLSIIMGELPGSGVSVGRLVEYFPDIHKVYQPATDTEITVLNLFEVGRSNNTSYDLKTSPLTAFIAKYVGFDEIREMRSHSYSFFQGTISSEEFLTNCNPALITVITNGVIKLLENRKAALLGSWKSRMS
ncbi:hypothetical protein H6F98_16590 [Microcoleus sp. FACHB-SPT15]|uniref:hypothetical protein n=1 Tax=Microcoleus sp. FACHB-SPT15 TaxID=2692830 RepID=UPI0017870110|nr:hypothetical protein [Microcoleus sp. FACHB-SPT15]MBD1807058.1 hypothetical protein [Microcoleus sp. FACHB-SPT15]